MGHISGEYKWSPETNRDGWIKSHSLLLAIPENSGKDEDICLAIGGGKANSCDARLLDGISMGEAREG